MQKNCDHRRFHERGHWRPTLTEGFKEMGLEGKRVGGSECEELYNRRDLGCVQETCNELSGLSGNMLGDYRESIKIFSYVYTPWRTHSLSV